MVWLYGFTQLHLFHDLPNNEILRGPIFTTRNLWLLNCIAKKASTKRSWRWHQRPAAKNRQFSTECPNLFTFFPLAYEYKWFLRPTLRGSGAFSNARGRQGRWEAHRTPHQAYTFTQISQNVVCIYSYVEQKAVCLLVTLTVSGSFIIKFLTWRRADVDLVK